MTVLDGPLRAVANQLLGQFGKAVTYRRLVPGTYDPRTSSTFPPTKTELGVRALVSDYKARYKHGQVEGVKEGDLVVEIAALALGADPSTSDEIVIDGRTYRVIHWDPTHSGDQAAMYAIHVRT